LRIYPTYWQVSPKQDPFAYQPFRKSLTKNALQSAFYPPGCYQPFTGTDIIATIKLFKKIKKEESF